MDQIETLLASMGVNVGTNLIAAAIWDGIKARFAGGSTSKAAIVEAVRQAAPGLSIMNANIVADTVVNFLAGNGDIDIQGSSIYARDTVFFRSSAVGAFRFGNRSVSKTKNTAIEAGPGAFIQGTGGAGVRQNPDGSIDFIV